MWCWVSMPSDVFRHAAYNSHSAVFLPVQANLVITLWMMNKTQCVVASSSLSIFNALKFSFGIIYDSNSCDPRSLSMVTE